MQLRSLPINDYQANNQVAILRIDLQADLWLKATHCHRNIPVAVEKGHSNRPEHLVHNLVNLPVCLLRIIDTLKMPHLLSFNG